MNQIQNRHYWETRARQVEEDDQVTHRDLWQKRLELEALEPHLQPHMRVLEVGCGNGYVTEFLASRVDCVDAFDQSPAMIERARARLQGAGTCRLFVASLPRPRVPELEQTYHTVVSVRVLINLQSQRDQAAALRWIAHRLRPGGSLLLLEGSSEGLEAINDLRAGANLPALATAAYNLNLDGAWLQSACEGLFEPHRLPSTGVYDMLTRYYYPLVVGPDAVTYNTPFHQAAYQACRQLPEGELARLSRLHVWRLVRQ